MFFKNKVCSLKIKSFTALSTFPTQNEDTAHVPQYFGQSAALALVRHQPISQPTPIPPVPSSG
jgi:hypothetical protein